MTKTVLVVDDDPTQRRLIQAVLEREGFGVAHAESGDAAIKHLQAGAAVDVILLDLVMPGLPGQDALKEMRARGFAQPVIVVTATLESAAPSLTVTSTWRSLVPGTAEVLLNRMPPSAAW